MLPKKFRLSKKTDIESVKRKKEFSGYCALLSFSAKRTAHDNPRLAMVLPRSLGKAVIRNRMRRMATATLYQIFPLMKPKTDIVAYPKVALLGSSASERSEGFLKMFKRAGLVNEEAD